MFDRMVADFVGFSDARPNYAALIEIPLRLREHATAKRADVDEPQAALSKIERKAMVEAGVDAKEKALAEARHKLAAVDDTVEKKHDLLRKVDEARAKLVAGDTNPAYNEALAVIAAADSQDDLATLYAEARRTSTPADDSIVRGIEATDAKIAKTEAEIAGLRRSAQELAKRRAEIEEVRDRFRRTGYDHPQTTFNNSGDIATMLQDVLNGAVRSGLLWDLLRRGYGSRPTRGTDFGGPDFPFPFPTSGGGRRSGSWGGGWRDPSSSGGWSPGSGGSGGGSSRRDDGDFSTGGSF
jgi:hypothetical protein